MKTSIYSFLLLICLASCTSKVSLSYNPVIETQTEKNIVMKVGDFEDERTNKPQHIGSLRNLYGMPIVKIVTDENVPTWISDAIKTELQNAGYKLANEGEDALYTVEGKVLKTFAHSYFLYHGAVSVDMSLKKQDQIVFQKVYISDKNNGFNWVGRSSTCIKGLEYNLQEICRKFIADVNATTLSELENSTVTNIEV